MHRKSFAAEVMKTALPVAFQSMLQSSFSMVDQIMVGQLGETDIAAIEVAGKPSFIYSIVLGAVAAGAGIMVSQYIGKQDRDAEEKSISLTTALSVCIGLLFAALTFFFAGPFVGMFTGDEAVIAEGKAYLSWIGWTFVPTAFCTLLAVPIRCRGKSSWPLYVSLLSAIVNTLLNYVLIFGHLGFPALGIRGAAVASLVSQVLGAVVMLLLFRRLYGSFRFSVRLEPERRNQFIRMLMPLMMNEFLWAVGQTINTFVYGHLSTEELAGMSLTSPVQGLMIGALSGLSQAAGILIGRRLGEKQYDEAYSESIRICLYGFAGSVLLSLALVLLRFRYISLYRVGETVQDISAGILLAFAVLVPVKVGNMILGGGVIRSGGKTRYIMMIDMFGTWVIGVPLVLFTGLYLKLPIVLVYFISSQEELIRYIISIRIFKGRKWMNTLE